MQSNVKKTFSHYELCGKLGQGGFAEVHKAIDTRTGTEVAIKMIKKKQIRNSKMTERVQQEVGLHIQLNNPNVLQLLGVHEDSKYVYLILEYCELGDLGHLLKQRQFAAFDEDETRNYMRQVVAGMTYLHKNKIMHRDISMGNLLINKDGVLKIADFGLAKQNNMPEEKNITMCGTPNFICPEIASRDEHGPEADVWSMGVLMYTLLTGKPPFETDGPAYKTLERVKNGDYVMPQSLSPEARDLIACMLRKEPKERIPLSKVAEHPFILGKTQQQHRINMHTPSPIPSPENGPLTHHHNHYTLSNNQVAGGGGGVSSYNVMTNNNNNIAASSSSLSSSSHHSLKSMSTTGGLANNTTNTGASGSFNESIDSGRGTLTTSSSSMPHNVLVSSSNSSRSNNNNIPNAFRMGVGLSTAYHHHQSTGDGIGGGYHMTNNNNNTTSSSSSSSSPSPPSSEQIYDPSKYYANSLSTKLGSVAISSNGVSQQQQQHHQMSNNVPNHHQYHQQAPPHSYQMYGQQQSSTAMGVASSALPRSASSYAASMAAASSASSSNSSNTTKSKLYNNRYSLQTPVQHQYHPIQSQQHQQQPIMSHGVDCATTSAVAATVASPPIKLHSPTRENVSYFQTGQYQTTTTLNNNGYSAPQYNNQINTTTTTTTGGGAVYSSSSSHRQSEAAVVASTSSQTDKQKTRLLSPPRIGPTTLIKPHVFVVNDKYKIYYLEGNKCVVEWFKSLRKKTGEYRDQVSRFDFDKGVYEFYQADCVPKSERPPEPSSSSQSNQSKLKTYSYETLPECYWKKFNIAAHYTKIIMSKMPKVKCYASEARCVLYHLGNFEIEFYDMEVKIVLEADGTRTRVILSDNHSFDYDVRNPTTMLPVPLTPSDLKEKVELAYERYQYCREEEELREARWRQNPSACQAFPITIGQKPSNSTSVESTIHPQQQQYHHHLSSSSTSSRSSSNRPYNNQNIKYSTAMPHRASSQALH